MTAFRLFSKMNTFFGANLKPCSSGALKFYDAGTTTPRDVYGDPGLTIDNGVTVALDASGRPNVDVWGEGAYFVELYDGLGVKQGEADNVSIPGDSGSAIPALVADQFLTNDGALLIWQGIRQVPDPTGMSGKVLGTDGANLLWQAPFDSSDLPDSVPTVSDFSVQMGDLLFQWGSSQAPVPATVGAQTTSIVVTFPKQFTSFGHMSITPILSEGVDANVTPILPSWSVSGVTQGSAAINATVNFTVPFEGDVYDSTHDGFHAPVPFTWFAVGKVAT